MNTQVSRLLLVTLIALSGCGDGTGCPWGGKIDDVYNCGSCGNMCEDNNVATRACVRSVCQPVCNRGKADCNGSVANDGCEVNIFDDTENCGGCGQACSHNNIEAPVCISGGCVGTCNPGFANCDKDRRTSGCEVNIDTDVHNCGGCGWDCPAPPPHMTITCERGQCSAPVCAPDYAECNSDPNDGCEANLKTDTDNCGTCGNKCALAHQCKNGSCT